MGPPRRRLSSAPIRPALLVFVEGRRTEELYLVDWHRRQRERILVAIHPFRGEPLQLVEKALATKRAEAHEERKLRGRPHDQIWCVFDRDEHRTFAEAIALAERNDIFLAISNPCLELWFLLHFQDQTAHLERHAAQERVQTLLHCSKVLSESALVELAERYDAAKERAMSLDAMHARDGSPPASNPSSSVWKLIDVIRDG